MDSLFPKEEVKIGKSFKRKLLLCILFLRHLSSQYRVKKRAEIITLIIIEKQIICCNGQILMFYVCGLGIYLFK